MVDDPPPSNSGDYLPSEMPALVVFRATRGAGVILDEKDPRDLRWCPATGIQEAIPQAPSADLHNARPLMPQADLAPGSGDSQKETFETVA